MSFRRRRRTTNGADFLQGGERREKKKETKKGRWKGKGENTGKKQPRSFEADVFLRIVLTLCNTGGRGNAGERRQLGRKRRSCYVQRPCKHQGMHTKSWRRKVGCYFVVDVPALVKFMNSLPGGGDRYARRHVHLEPFCNWNARRRTRAAVTFNVSSLSRAVLNPPPGFH